MFLDRFLHWASHQKEVARWKWITWTTLCKENAKKVSAEKTIQKPLGKSTQSRKRSARNLNESLKQRVYSFRTSRRHGFISKTTDRRPASFLDVHNIKTSKKNWDEDLRLRGDVCRKLGEVACTSKERTDELQEKVGCSCRHIQRELRRVLRGFQIVTSQEFSFLEFLESWFFDLSLLFPTKWLVNIVAESWGIRWPGTWEYPQFWAREANVLFWPRV